MRPPETVGGSPIDANGARAWREALGLSCTEAGTALNLSNPNVTFREYEGGRPIAPPTALLMDMTAAVTIALVLLRTGLNNDAFELLWGFMTPPMRQAISQHIEMMTPEIAARIRPD